MKSKKDIFGFFLKLAARTFFFMSIIKLSSLFKLSFVFGSKFATFSGSGATMPLTGLFAGGLVSFVIFIFLFLIRYIIFGLSSLHVLAFYIPGLFAALSFTKNRFFGLLVRFILPVLCIILFIMHPVGSRAPFYALLWIIPVGIYLLKKKNMFLQALSATFVAHSVGSVIFLYTVGLNGVLWNSLIPIVLLERLVLASSIFALYKVGSWTKEKAYNFYKLRYVPSALGQKSKGLV